MRRIVIALMLALLWTFPCQAADGGANQEEKGIGQKFKEGAKDIGQGFKEGAKEVGQGAKDIGKKIKEDAKETSKEFKESMKESKEEAQKKGRSIGEWFRDAGRQTGDAFRQAGKSIRKFFTGDEGVKKQGRGGEGDSYDVVESSPGDSHEFLRRPSAVDRMGRRGSRQFARGWCRDPRI